MAGWLHGVLWVNGFSFFHCVASPFHSFVTTAGGVVQAKAALRASGPGKHDVHLDTIMFQRQSINFLHVNLRLPYLVPVRGHWQVGLICWWCLLVAGLLV